MTVRAPAAGTGDLTGVGPRWGRSLVNRGMDVLQAASGVDALHCLTVTPVIDVVFTDIRMPGGVTGWELAAASARPDRISGWSIRRDLPRGRSGLVPGSIFLDKPVRFAHPVQAIHAAARKTVAEDGWLDASSGEE